MVIRILPFDRRLISRHLRAAGCFQVLKVWPQDGFVGKYIVGNRLSSIGDGQLRLVLGHGKAALNVLFLRTNGCTSNRQAQQ